MILDQLTRRDSSLCLAVAALLRDPAGQGAMPFADLAVAYREDYLAAEQATGDGHRDPGMLSMDDVRRHLATSVLPRLATERTIEERAEWSDDTIVRLQPPVWSELSAAPEMARLMLVEAAAGNMRTHGAPPAVAPRPAVTNGSRLEGHGLTTSYGGRTVVNDVHVHVAQGEIVGMLGPNGAGKTTTFYMMTGLVKPQAGRITLDGKDIGNEPMFRRARRGIGYLAQEPSVFRKLTVEENLLAILETLDISRKEQLRRLEVLLDELAIRHLRKSKAFSLSGGERRRLEITRALVTEPKFMLLDEPFSGVDPIAVHDIQSIVAGLRHKGIGVLITDHNVEQTLDIVDRAYIMFEGRVQVSGTVRELVWDDKVSELYLGPTLTARLRSRLSPVA